LQCKLAGERLPCQSWKNELTIGQDGRLIHHKYRQYPVLGCVLFEADNEEKESGIDTTSSNVNSGSSSSSSNTSNRQQVTGRIISSVLDSDGLSHSFDDKDND
jgi:hypothetical protein